MPSGHIQWNMMLLGIWKVFLIKLFFPALNFFVHEHKYFKKEKERKKKKRRQRRQRKRERDHLLTFLSQHMYNCTWSDKFDISVPVKHFWCFYFNSFCWTRFCDWTFQGNHEPKTKKEQKEHGRGQVFPTVNVFLWSCFCSIYWKAFIFNCFSALW